MNSRELQANVPLATQESDEEEFEFAELQTGAPPPLAPRLEQLSLEAGGDSISGSLEDLAAWRPGGSLEDLVSTFDEKLTMCFADYQDQTNQEVDKIAPVQVRSQEEIMNECQVWWTLTGNFGNMMPIDWSRSYTRAAHLPTLNLCDPRHLGQGGVVEGQELGEEDDLVAADLDMHQLILQSEGGHTGAEPIKTAEDVMREIEDIIDEDDEEEENRAAGADDRLGYLPPHSVRSSTFIGQALQGRRLEELSVEELQTMLADIEVLVRDLSEELVADLGSRDELEFEKELKNNFISLLLSIQSKRRQQNVDGGTPSRRRKGDREMKYLTTVIPYNAERGCPPLSTLQVLVKILKSINEDSPAVPALLTDYILKILCPT